MLQIMLHIMLHIMVQIMLQIMLHIMLLCVIQINWLRVAGEGQTDRDTHRCGVTVGDEELVARICRREVDAGEIHQNSVI